MYEFLRHGNPYRLAMFTAWHTAMFTRMKKIPDLDRLMGDTPRRASEAELRAKVIAINAAFGGRDLRHG